MHNCSLLVRYSNCIQLSYLTAHEAVDIRMLWQHFNSLSQKHKTKARWVHWALVPNWHSGHSWYCSQKKMSQWPNKALHAFQTTTITMSWAKKNDAKIWQLEFAGGGSWWNQSVHIQWAVKVNPQATCTKSITWIS